MSASLRYDHYKVLGIERDATPQRIKQAYRSRVKQCHPDRDPSPGAHARFLVVQQAYTVLSDPEQRFHYDERSAYYRPAQVHPSEPVSHRTATRTVPDPTIEDHRVPRFAFLGLHVTGLLFGLCMVSGILLGVVLNGWPIYALFFLIPGLAVIPDSIEGLRMKQRKVRDAKSW